MKTYLALILVLIFTQSFGQTKVSAGNNYVSISLPKDDSAFLALKDTAQAHLQLFIDSLNIHGADTGRYIFTVKSDFIENDDHEHMWSQILNYKSKKFEGVFIDSPFVIKNIKTGDKVLVQREAIEDWSIYDKLTGKTLGYYSEMYLDSKKE